METRKQAWYGSWIVANGWSEALGLGGTFTLGLFLAPLFGNSTSIAMILAGALAAITLGILLEGVLVGFAQEHILRSRSPVPIHPLEWTCATASGAGAAWLLGILPSTIFAILNRGAEAPAPAEPPLMLRYGLATLLGVLLGPILGYAQCRVLRRYTSRAGIWVLANAAAWGIGMPIIFAGMDVVPWTAGKAFIIPALFLICGATGLVVGTIHGKFLVRLFRNGG